MCDEITYPFPNINAATVEVWKWINNFFLHFTGMWLLIHARMKLNHVSKGSQQAMLWLEWNKRQMPIYQYPFLA